MQYEGHLRDQFLAHDGTFRDAVVYAAVASSGLTSRVDG